MYTPSVQYPLCSLCLENSRDSGILPPHSIERFAQGKIIVGLMMTSWLAKRRKMRLDLARAFAARSAISERDFMRIFYDPACPPRIGDFDSQYLPDPDVLDEILRDVSETTGLAITLVRSHFSRAETFAQFGEHLLRAGAYSRGKP